MNLLTRPGLRPPRWPAGAAYAAYRSWRDHEGTEAVVAAAVLAANPRNVQPWWFDLGEEHGLPFVDLYADTTRREGPLDPFDRELYVGLGCALENMTLAARANGMEPRVRLLPDTAKPAWAARVILAPLQRPPSALEAELHAAIPLRRTNRAPYRRRPVPPELLAEAAALADDLPGTRVCWLTSRSERDRIGALLVEATEAIVADEEQSRAGHAWFRHTRGEVERHRDGMTLDTQGLPPLLSALGQLLPPRSRATADRFWVRRTRGVHVPTAAAYGLVTVADAAADRDRLLGGRLLQRVHLFATARGLAVGHLNMMTVRADRERQLGAPPRFTHALAELAGSADGPGRQVLATFRIGFPRRAAAPSPRRPVHEVIRRPATRGGA
ncbi:MAG: hypothetical protein IRY90_01670 [Actinomadura rubrobrunea]|nr:hypothetical protein [Actinomadura rubrobrunea]